MRFSLWRRFCPGILCAVVLASCAPRIAPPVAPPVAPSIAPSAIPIDFPEAYYRQAQTQRKILRIDPNRSLVTIAVHRGGPFARLGHEHVVASHHVAGYADPEAGRTDLYLPLERLSVDEPALRAEAKLDTQLSPEDIEGTRRNMLTRVLDAEHYPWVLIHAEYAAAGRAALRVTITLHGVRRSFDVPISIQNRPDGIVVNGELALTQTEFGMTPMSAFGGAIQVQDRLDLRFRIVAL